MTSSTFFDDEILRIGNIISASLSLLSALNFLIFQKKKEIFSRLVFFLQFFSMVQNLSYLSLNENIFNIPPSVAIFANLLATYSLLFTTICIILIYISGIQYIFDSGSSIRSQKRIEKAFLLFICLSILIALYPIFEQQAESSDFIYQKNNNTFILLVIFPSILLFFSLLLMLRARQKRLTYNKEMRSLLINNNMLTEPKIIMAFTIYNIAQLTYTFSDKNRDISIDSQLLIPYSFCGFIISFHYIFYSGLYKSSIIDKIKSTFSDDSFNDDRSLVGDPHAETMSNEFDKK
ncbi:transmembrane protein, putative (macronuclear) [Tetrahymena thermophila SB210]|uniref:Transmembrane protein, putative n=1 Tax=Tetrahymena thermophila (strain SB210) TaxID=312017 RepID=I7LXW8_TETTS|nr:transmembrane protein, putative [Tetrahymena thermophila SB210]EAS06340.2 transmembrane protein, putative [Tetrahymena thermophila SB210]|eukprot:XP_001026585.2 transmembrane protein, putative [Tetrahymena thermophila SB210]